MIRITHKRCLDVLFSRDPDALYHKANDHVSNNSWIYHTTCIADILGYPHNSALITRPKLTIRTGGYDTPSTIARLNAILEYIGQPRIYKKKHALYHVDEQLVGPYGKWLGRLLFEKVDLNLWVPVYENATN